MKSLIVLAILLYATMSEAKSGIKENTDIGKRKVISHHQVTSCRNDEYCKINSVTEFDKYRGGKVIYYGECTFSSEDGKRYQECKVSGIKKKQVVKTVIKKVIKVKRVYKKNRIQVHIAKGPTGLEKSGDNNSEEIKEKIYYFQGLQYTRMLNSRFSIGATVFTNKSASVTMGLDY